MSGKALILRAETAKSVRIADHPGFEFERKVIVGKDDSSRFNVCVYEVPPGKATYPYHYHMQNEEVFYIISGTGTLKCPEGEKTVGPGDFLYFPNNPEGAHKITNASETEPLVYADFDLVHETEVAFYPNSGKVGIYGRGSRLLFQESKKVDYYEGE